MNREELLLALVRVAVCGATASEELKNACTPEGLEEVCALARSHDLAHLVGQAASKLALPASRSLETCKRYAMEAMFRCTQQTYAYTQICEVLEAEGIDFLPLKGSVLRDAYPEPWLRTSCDLDILVRGEELERASQLLQERLGYRYRGRSPHDLLLDSPLGVHLELHFSVMEDFISERSAALLSGIWEYAVAAPGKKFQKILPDPLFYYYHMAHMAKHFVNGGCGIRTVLDVWILTHRVNHDPQARDALLEQGGLLTFARGAERLAEIWFSGASADALSGHMHRYIFDGGVYGNLQNRVSINQTREGGKLRYALSKIILPYDIMKHYYPVLQKYPLLTPVYQVVRWCRLLFCGGVRRSVRELQVNAAVSRDQNMTAGKLLKYLEL